jgi:hypothetical protein
MAVTVKVDGKSARWVQMLEDFGHLSPDDADRLLVGVGELVVEGPQRLGQRAVSVDGRAVRRAAAMLLFSQSVEVSKALDEDWPLLFS